MSKINALRRDFLHDGGHSDGAGDVGSPAFLSNGTAGGIRGVMESERLATVALSLCTLDNVRIIPYMCI